MVFSQNLDWHYIECEERMWKVAHRTLPIGLQIEGAMEWFVLHQSFISYLVTSQSKDLDYLKKFFGNSFLAVEVILECIFLKFHTNSKNINFFKLRCFTMPP